MHRTEWNGMEWKSHYGDIKLNLCFSGFNVPRMCSMRRALGAGDAANIYIGKIDVSK